MLEIAASLALGSPVALIVLGTSLFTFCIARRPWRWLPWVAVGAAVDVWIQVALAILQTNLSRRDLAAVIMHREIVGLFGAGIAMMGARLLATRFRIEPAPVQPAKGLALVGAIVALAIGFSAFALPGFVPNFVQGDVSLARLVVSASRDADSRRFLDLAAMRADSANDALKMRLPGSAGAILYVVGHELGWSAAPGAYKLVATLGTVQTPEVLSALRGVVRGEDAHVVFRVLAAEQLARAHDAQSKTLIQDMLLRSREDPAWGMQRPRVVRALVSFGIDDDVRSVLHSLFESTTRLTGEERIEVALALAPWDDPDDRRSFREWFCDAERFDAAATPYAGAGVDRRLGIGFKAVLSDMLAEPDLGARVRACEWLVDHSGDASRAFVKELEKPCRMIRRPSSAIVAEGLRVELALPPPRAPLSGLAACKVPRSPQAYACSRETLDLVCMPTQLAFSTDGNRLAVVSEHGVDVFDLVSEERIGKLTGGFATALDGTGDHGVVFGDPDVVHVFDVGPAAKRQDFPLCTAKTVDVAKLPLASRIRTVAAIAPAGDLVAVGGDGICIWSLAKNVVIRRIDACSPGEGSRMRLGFAADGRSLVVSCPSGSRIVDVLSGAILAKGPRPTGFARWRRIDLARWWTSVRLCRRGRLAGDVRASCTAGASSPGLVQARALAPTGSTLLRRAIAPQVVGSHTGPGRHRN